MTLTRRTLLTVAASTAAALAATTVLPRFIDAALAQPAAGAAGLIQNTGNQLVAIVNSSASVAERRQRLQQVIDSTVDVEGIARFCLGRFWRQATPAQQQQYLALFHQVLMNSITGHLGEYRGVRFEMGRAQQRAEGSVVSTTVDRPNNPPTAVDWVVEDVGGSPKIVDVVAEGVSMRQTQRSDYAAFLTRNGSNVQALIEAMRQQTTQNG